MCKKWGTYAAITTAHNQCFSNSYSLLCLPTWGILPGPYRGIPWQLVSLESVPQSSEQWLGTLQRSSIQKSADPAGGLLCVEGHESFTKIVLVKLLLTVEVSQVVLLAK